MVLSKMLESAKKPEATTLYSVLCHAQPLLTNFTCNQQSGVLVAIQGPSQPLGVLAVVTLVKEESVLAMKLFLIRHGETVDNVAQL